MQVITTLVTHDSKVRSILPPLVFLQEGIMGWVFYNLIITISNLESRFCATIPPILIFFITDRYIFIYMPAKHEYNLRVVVAILITNANNAAW